jgi:hypothetical protein
MAVLHDILTALFPPLPEPIAELEVGRRVTVRGGVVARDVLYSPLTGEACVYYHYAVEEWRASRIAGVADGSWRPVELDEAIAEFYVQDDTGRAIVAPQRARVDRGPGVEPEAVPLGMAWRRARELLIRPGDRIEVTAIADRVDDLYDDARDYRAAAHRAMLRAPEHQTILIRLLGSR